MSPTIGILALQGAVDLHASALARLDIEAVMVRTPTQLDTVDALILPGGESSAMSKLLVLNGLFDPLQIRLHDGMPALGTCAGMILLAAGVLDGRADQRSFAAIDIDVRRNAFGRQNDSFETELELPEIGEVPIHAVFIRAPVVERTGAEVEVLATIDGDRPVACRQGAVIVTSFHPELADDLRVHELFLAGVAA
ncbi:MAG: pyridoxal 5'-phosphate synthase glutaminase subunit PdxT [Actinobacteria bacterium]|uniref:glutaminase n=1 Tax=freshwater metagenome TaxID=449393 RepID=A0A6J5YH27_9ZZZZ|nr:pyridoxal 5'-phosphate synthase glutaminase subunit PdxT [Actinomycetota bacterium]MTA77241.1 pyridoxal 5'-phosphate synthase glutaminase subunit PdxT [Actinomycetota bacterium]